MKRRTTILLVLVSTLCCVMPVPAQQDSIVLFRPDPTKATLLALVPGLGQIYNRNYWKLPIVYGAFMGCIYAVTWNNRNYTDYHTAYRDVRSDDPLTHDSWKNLVPASVPPESVDTYPQDNPSFIENIRQRKDYFRRYRDLSIIISVGVYALSLIDAYVDAQLFDFDISSDLSLHVRPNFLSYPSATNLALTCSFSF